MYIIITILIAGGISLAALASSSFSKLLKEQIRVDRSYYESGLSLNNEYNNIHPRKTDTVIKFFILDALLIVISFFVCCYIYGVCEMSKLLIVIFSLIVCFIMQKHKF